MKFTSTSIFRRPREIDSGKGSLPKCMSKMFTISLLLFASLALLQSSATARLTLEPVDFGSVRIGETKSTSSGVGCNLPFGDVCPRIGRLRLVGTNASEFQITNDGCSEVSLPGGGHCLVEIRFTPQLPAGFKEARIVDIDNSQTLWILFGFADGFTLKIIRPTPNEIFRLNPPDFITAGPITFEAEIAAPNQNNVVTWNVKLEYQTRGGQSLPDETRTFVTQAPASASHDETYKSMGGKLTINAFTIINGEVKNAAPVTVFIVGVPIPEARITERLIKLYRGTTPNLMTGIAHVESEYAQFRVRTLYGIEEPWPNEDSDGSRVGLMRVETTMTDAWDWEANTETGVNRFKRLRLAARGIMRRIIKEHKGLRGLIAVELENMTLILYGPHASFDRSRQYYAPIRVNGRWVWTVNTAGNPEGVEYADTVRANMK